MVLDYRDAATRPGGAVRRFWGDTGVALHLGHGDELSGAHLENLVLADLLAWRDARLDRAEVFYWRTAIGERDEAAVAKDSLTE